MKLPFYAHKLNLVFSTATAFALLSTCAAKGQTRADKVHLGFVYPLSTHGTSAASDTNNFSLHALAGVSAGEQGLAVAGVSQVVKHDVRGVIISGISNHVGGNIEGLAIAGISNTYGKAKGIQVAGITNISRENIRGSQIAGILNRVTNITGFQGSGLANVAGQVEGSQVAGFVNTAKAVEGYQFAGFSNVGGTQVSGSQVSGFINTAKDVSGSQVAGFINIARKVKGAQIAGFINIADSSDHPIGIINIIKNGEKSVGLTIDETQTTMLAFRSGGKSLYGIIGIGYNLRNDDEVYAAEVGLGAHLLRSKVLRLNAELSAQTLESFHYGEYFKSSFKLMPSIKAGKSFELMAGPSLNFINTNTFEGKKLVDDYLWERQNRRHNGFEALYLGYTIGVNVHF